MKRLKALINKYSFGLHPLLFAIFPLLSFYGANAAEISVGQFQPFTFLIFNLVVGAIAWGISWVLLRDKFKAGLFSVGLLAVFFMFGRAHDVIGAREIKAPVITLGATTLLVGASLVFLFGLWWMIRRQSNETTRKANLLLTLVAAAMVASSLVTIGAYLVSGEKPASDKPANDTNNTVQTLETGGQKPDVYYIVLDGYAREDILAKDFGYDNSDFIEGLESYGFYVADKSNSNFAHTHFSLPSTMNMKDLTYLADEVGRESSDRTPLRKLLQNAEAVNTFKSLGYKYTNIGTQWGWTEAVSPQSNLDIPGPTVPEEKIFNIRLDEFALVYMQTTFLKPWISTDIRESLVAKTLAGFERTESVAKIDEPTFTLTHIVAPHPPYLFNENGVDTALTPLELDNHGFSNKEKYLSQTTYINKRTLEMIDKILKDSKTPPIIILASDHGPATALNTRDLIDIDPTKLNEDGVRMRMGILNAYYFPDQNYDSLYENITPVNSLRLVLSQYFDQNLKLLPDTVHYSGNKFNNEYKFFDVTDIVNQ